MVRNNVHIFGADAFGSAMEKRHWCNDSENDEIAKKTYIDLHGHFPIMTIRKWGS